MSQVPARRVSATGTAAPPDGSASPSEKNATSSASLSTPAPTPRPPKLRSCAVCRTRKVRCDKLSPCSNCRRANITCVFPSTDRQPKWARRLERVTNNAATSAKISPDADPGVGQVMERLRNLESLVQELSGQLEQANAATSSNAGGSSSANSPGSFTHGRDTDHQVDTSSATTATVAQKQFGRMVLQDASRSRYVSSGFWSRVYDELNGLKIDTRGLPGSDSDSSEEDSLEKTPSTQELERTPSERHAFLFRHNLGPSQPNLREFHPLPSQIPYLLNVYAENVNVIIQIVHIPTVTKMIRDLHGNDVTSLTPANEALMFSIYYAAITSMEEDDIVTNFGATKAELNLKYRLGLEHALARADFLNIPDIVLVQAFAIFLFLVRRHDSPRFVWMMTGLVIRMAQALGMQRDGSHFEHLTPFQVEIRRRVWWALCLLDVRASEDQGTDLTIMRGSSDTKLPLNVNDADLKPDMKSPPIECHGLTDMTIALVTFETCDLARQMMAPGVTEETPNLDGQIRLLKEIYDRLERGYLQYVAGSVDIRSWVLTTCTRLMMAKMTLIVYLPVLFSSPSGCFSNEIRTKLLVSAIEVAEYNHALNSDPACRHWRWIYQTYTHWHAIVYLLIEISRRLWSPIVERAWAALHSSWLIPAQANMNKNLRIWVPLRKLMAKARKHRDAELERLRGDASAARQLGVEDLKIPLPASSVPFSAGKSGELFRERWRKLVELPEETKNQTQSSGMSSVVTTAPPIVVHTVDSIQQNLGSGPVYSERDPWSNIGCQRPNIGGETRGVNQDLLNTDASLDSAMATNSLTEVALGRPPGPSFDTVPAVPEDWSGDISMGPGFTPWLWPGADPSVDVLADVDVNMDLDGEVNWYNWLESAKDMEWNSGPSGDSRS